MPRIFKGIETELRMLLHPCILTGEITDIKVALFTDDPSVAIEFTDRYTIEDNILKLTVPKYIFDDMEDGLINYVIKGKHNNADFITDRQSNYFLKTPTNYIPSERPVDIDLGELETKITKNGVFEYTPSDVDAWEKATITVEVADLNGSFNEGYIEGIQKGYERGYKEGCEEGENIVGRTARVLNVTENHMSFGTSYSRFADFQIPYQHTGVYEADDDEETYYYYGNTEMFCSYATLDTFSLDNITKLELWYLPNMPHMGDGYHRVLHTDNDTIHIVFGGGGVKNTELDIKFGTNSVTYTPTKPFGTEWLHITADLSGVTVNDTELPFPGPSDKAFINQDLSINGPLRFANGTYGLLKLHTDNYTYHLTGGDFSWGPQEIDREGLVVFPNLGVLEDGTPITKATYLNGAVFDTGLKITEDSTIELWINKYEQGPSGYYLYSDLFSVRRDSRFWYVNTTSLYSAESYRNYTEHITISKADGFVVEDGDGTHTFSLDSINFSSGNDTIKIRTDNANFAYGLLKINGNIIVPSEDGFTNITTNTPLRRCEEWGGTFEYKNGFNRSYSTEPTLLREDTLIKSVNVHIEPKINVAKEGLQFGHSTFREIPEWADFEGVTNMYYMFLSCSSLENVRDIDTSLVTNMNSCFNNCANLKQIATLDTSNVNNMQSMCQDCKQLIEFPPLNTIRVTNMREMFRSCGSLKKVSALDARSVVKQSYGLFGVNPLNNLTDFGGLIGLKASMDNYSFEKCPNLTYESCINILNGLYDFTGNGLVPTSNEGKLKVHSNFLTIVGDDIAIATEKGWTITT